MELGSASGKIEMIYDGAGVAQAKADLGTLGAAGADIGKQLSTVGASMIGLGAAVGTPFVLAAKDALAFGSNMANVNSILHLGDEAVAGLGDSVQGLSAATGKGPVELSAALYDIVSSGFAGEEALNILEVAANAATAGMTDTATAAGAIDAVLNSGISTIDNFATSTDEFGNATLTAGHAADVMFQTVADGVITFDQLATNMGNTLPAATALGVSFDELGAAYAQMTLQGVNASAAETQISGLMKSALNPTTQLTAALNDHGYATAQDAIASEGLAGFLGIVEDAAGGNSAALYDMLGTQEAVNAAMILGKDGAKDYKEEVDNMANASEGAGAAEKARQEILESGAAQLDRLGAAFNALSVAIGESFEPVIASVAHTLSEFVFGLADASPEVLKFVATFGAVAAGILTVGGGIALAVGKVAQLSAAFSSAGLSLGKFALGLGIAGIALAALIAAYQTNFLGFADFVDEQMARAGEAIHDFSEGFDAAFSRGQEQGLNDVANGVQAFGDALLYATGIDITGFTDAASAAIQAFGDGVEQALTNGVNPISAALHGMAMALQSLGLTDLATQVNDAGIALITFGNTFAEVTAGMEREGFSSVAAAVGAFGVALDELLGTDVSGYFRDAAEAIQAFGDEFETARANGIDPFTAALLGLRAAAEEITGLPLAEFFDNLGGTLSSAAEGVQTFIQTLTSGDISGAFDQLGEAVGTAVRGIGDALGPALQQVATDAQTKLQEVSDTIASALSSIDIAEVAVNIQAWIAGKIADLAAFIKEQTGVDVGAIDIGQIAVNIASWLVSAAQTIGTAIHDFVLGNGANPNGGGSFPGGNTTGVASGIDIGQIAVSIASWVVSAAQSIGDAVRAFVTGTGASSSSDGQRYSDASGGIDLGAIAVSIGSWVVSSLQSIADAVRDFVTGGGADPNGGGSFRGGTGGGIDLGEIAVSIGSWLVSAAQEVGSAVKAFIDEHKPGEGFDVGEIAINVVSWIVSATQSVADAVEAFVSGGGTGGSQAHGADAGPGGAPIDVGPVPITVGSWEIQLDTNPMDELKKAVDAKVAEFDFGTLLDIATISSGVGEAVRNVMDAINKALSVAFTPEGLVDIGKALLAIGLAIESAVVGFAAGFVFKQDIDFSSIGTAIMAALNKAIGDLDDLIGGSFSKSGGESAGLFQAVVDNIQAAADGLGPLIEGALAGLATAFEQIPAKVKEAVAALPGQVAAAMGVSNPLDAIPKGVEGWVNEIRGQGEVQGVEAGSEYITTLANGLPVGLATGDAAIASAVQQGGESFGDKLGAFASWATGTENVQGMSAEIAGPITEQAVSGVEQGASDAASQVDGAVQSAGLQEAVDGAMAAEFSGVSLTTLSTAIGEAINQAIVEGVSSATATGGDFHADTGSIGLSILNSLVDSLNATDFGPVGTIMNTKISEAVATGAEGGGEGSVVTSLGQNIADSLNTSLAGASFAEIGTTISGKLSEAMIASSGAEGAEGATAIGQSLADSINNSLQTAEFSAIGTTISAKISEAMIATSGEGAEGGGTSAIGTNLVAAINNALATAPWETVGTTIQTQLTTQMTTALSAITATVTAQAQPIGSAIGQGIGAGVTATAGFVTTSMTSMMTAAIAAAQAIAATAQTIGSAVGQAVGAGITATSGFVTSAITSMMTSAIAAAQGIASQGQTIGSVLGQAVGAGISATAGFVLSAATTMMQGALTAAQGIAATAQTVGSAFGQAVGAGITATSGFVSTSATTMVTAAITAGSTAAAGANAVGTAFDTAVGSGIGAGTSTATGAVEAMVGAAIDAGVNAAAGAEAIGAAISSGAAIGVDTHALDAVVAEMVNNGIAAGKAAAESASPSKKAERELGKPIAEGAAQGVDFGSGQFADSVENMVSGGIDKVRKQKDDAEDAGKEVGNSLGKGMGDGVEEGVSKSEERAARAAKRLAKRALDQLQEATGTARFLGEDFAANYWAGAISSADSPALAQWMTDQMVNAATTAIGKAQALMAGLGQQLDIAEGALSGLDKDSEEYQAAVNGVNAIKDQYTAAQKAMATAQVQASEERIEQLNKELDHAKGAAEKQNIKGQIELEEERVNVAHQLEEALAGVSSAMDPDSLAIANAQVDFLTAQLEALGKVDVNQLLSDIADSLSKAADELGNAADKLNNAMHGGGGGGGNNKDKNKNKGGGGGVSAEGNGVTADADTLEDAMARAQEVVEKLSALVDEANGLFGDAAAKAHEQGAAVSVGFAEGMESALDRIRAAAQAMVDAAATAVAAQAQIASPSKLFEKLGLELPAGFAQGIDRGAPQVGAAAGAMVGDATRDAMLALAKSTNLTPAWKPQASQMVSDRNAQTASYASNQQWLTSNVSVELDGEKFGEAVVEEALGPIGGALSRVGSSRRMGV